MAFDRGNLGKLAGSDGFTLWSYTTADSDIAVRSSGYFNAAADQLRVGDAMIVNGFTMGVGSNASGVVDLAPSATAESVGTIDAVRRGALGDNQKSSAEANTTDIQAAIDEAADLSLRTSGKKHAGVVYLPPGEYYVNGLTMKTQVTLRGAGPSTILRLNDGIAAPLIKISGGTNHTNIRDMRLRGNKYGGGGNGVAHGIDIQTSEETDSVRDNELYGFHGDAQHRLYNLTIDAIDGYGLHLWTRACHVDHVMISDTTEHGMRILGSDNWFSNMDLNWIGKTGVFIEGGNNAFTAVKAWYIGTDPSAATAAAFRVDSSRNMFIGCQAQDVSTYGFYFAGQDYNTLVGCLCDNIGNWFENTGLGTNHGPSGPQTAVFLDTRGGGNGCSHNNIQVQIAQRSGNAQLQRAVAIGADAGNNTVTVQCNSDHIRGGGAITTFSGSIGVNNVVYENGRPITDGVPG